MNAWWRGLALVATTGALLVTAASSGCGSSRKNKGNGGGGGGGGGTTSTSQLNFQIVGADIPASGTTKPFVRFKVTDASGAAINLLQEIQNDASSTTAAPVYPRMRPRFTIAQFNPQTRDYTSYYQTTAGTAAVPVATFDPPTRVAGQPVPFPTAQLTDEGGGVWRYDFTQPFTTPNLTPGGTNTVAIFAQRTLAPATANDKPSTWNASATQSFVQGGTLQAAPYAAVSDSACNTCHEPALQAHGFRRGTQLCITCHSPQSKDPTSTTGDTVDFKRMIHRIHNAPRLPSELAGTPLTINGTDFSDVSFPRDIRDCTTCHTGAQATQADVWKAATSVSVSTCTSCHDSTQFEATSTATKSCNDPTYNPATDGACKHSGGLLGATAACAACHVPGTALGVDTVHVSPAVLAQAYKTQVVNLTLDASNLPTVTYKVTKADGTTPYDLPTAQSFNVQIGWEQPEFTNHDTPSTTPSQPIRLAGSTATATADPTTFQVVGTAAIPASVKNVRVWVEGHPALNGVNLPVVNSFKDFPVNGGGAITPRRQVVSTDNCNVCHGVLSAHGGNRQGAVEVCMVCHNPNATDIARSSLPAAGGAAQQTIDFKVLIHAVHGADIRTDDFVVWGFGLPPAGTTKVTFPGTVPANTANCNVCHVNQTFAPPLKPEVLGTAYDAKNPDTTRVPPTQSACTACHSSTKFDSSVASAKKCSDPTYDPTKDGACQHSGGLGLPDTACAGCHAVGGIADVQKIHASFVH